LPGLYSARRLPACWRPGSAGLSGSHFLEDDADIVHNSAQIDLNVLESCRRRNIQRVYYPSSACIDPGSNQMDPDSRVLEESSAYPAALSMSPGPS